MTGIARRVGLDVAALQQIIQASHAIPAIAVAFDDKPVLTAPVSLAVVFR